MRSIAFVVFLSACMSHGIGTDPGDHVYDGAVVSIVLDDQGGGFAPPPPSGPCDPQVARYTVTNATHDLAWSACDVVGTSPNQTTAPRTGHRVLEASEWASLTDALSAIVVVANDGRCGADKPTFALIVNTSNDTIEYADNFYACQNQNKPLVDGDALSHAMQVAGGLAMSK
ncbi:MAG TPA: hypothetical protein VL463_01105 [Kofleriaceae bacterium]|jgi:hypothetical protein|nr:hypothetical protein [Kofleriaceae bacterium]